MAAPALGEGPHGHSSPAISPHMKVTRRHAFRAAAGFAAGRLLAKEKFRLSICNETYDPLGFAAACHAIKQAGYGGVEIAPPTLSDDPAALPAARRAELRNIIQSEGLQYVGLHRLLTVPKGLQVTTPDAYRCRQHEPRVLRQGV